MVDVDTSEFVWSHGKEPRGLGFWAFDIGGEMCWFPEQIHSDDAILYSDAKKLAIEVAKQKGINKIKALS